MTADPDDVVRLAADLVRFDTTNFGGGESRGERPAAEYAVAALAEVGIDARLLESAPGRANVVARVPGADPALPALLVHGHLDVVPAVAADWQVDPFAGEIRDGMLWGRGTIDMKGACAITLATVRALARAGARPRRDVVLAFLADEEDTGAYGAGWLVEKHPDLFTGVSAAVSESGGFAVPAGASTVYPVAVGERGSAWMRLTARGTAGHASKVNSDNAVRHLVAALARIGEHRWPLRVPGPVLDYLRTVGDALGVGVDPADPEASIERLGAPGAIVAPTLRCSTVPTMLQAGYKVNVVPGEATAYVDGRVLPGCEADFEATVDQLLGPHVTREYVGHGAPVLTTWAPG